MKKLSQKDIQELLIILEYRRKLRIIKEFVANKYFFIPFIVMLVYIIDSPNIIIIDIIKKILSKFI